MQASMWLLLNKARQKPSDPARNPATQQENRDPEEIWNLILQNTAEKSWVCFPCRREEKWEKLELHSDIWKNMLQYRKQASYM